jgi:hypothetical protein
MAKVITKVFSRRIVEPLPSSPGLRRTSRSFKRPEGLATLLGADQTSSENQRLENRSPDHTDDVHPRFNDFNEGFARLNDFNEARTRRFND